MTSANILLDLSVLGQGIKHLSICNDENIEEKLARSCVIAENSSFYLTKNGRPFLPGDSVQNGDYLAAKFRLLGGKGGFGSMLRALGSQIEKTTNNEACRDLSGRRMRDVNNEKKMIEYVKQKAEKEREKEKKKIEKLEKCLVKPKHFFNDPAYEKSLEQTSDNVENALKTGLVAHKRKAETVKKPSKTKKSKQWLGFDDISGSSSDSDDDDFEINCRVSKNNSADSAGGSSSSNEDKSSLEKINEEQNSETRKSDVKEESEKNEDKSSSLEKKEQHPEISKDASEKEESEKTAGSKDSNPEEESKSADIKKEPET
ncbi:splicing regulator SDE2-like [Ciona intestinalis]